MNKKITLTELTEALATITKIPKRTCDTFLREMFSIITEELIAGESVKIKHLGNFKISIIDARKSIDVNTGEEIEIPEHKKILFVPEKELAEAINAPFEGFETIELDEGLDDKDLSKLDSVEKHIGNNEPIIEEKDNSIKADIMLPPPIPKKEEAEEKESPLIEKEIQPKENIEDEEVVVDSAGLKSDDASSDSSNSQESLEIKEPNSAKNDNKESGIVVSKGENSISNSQEQTNGKGILPTEAILQAYQEKMDNKVDDSLHNNIGKGYFYGFLSALFFFFFIMSILSFSFGFPVTIEMGTGKATNDTIIMRDTIYVKSSDIIKEQPIIPQAKIRTDTIRNNRFLTTMARKYYGDYNYWVYIYEENRDKIDNPNKIKIGTVVKIPSPEKYGIDKNNPESLKRAKDKAYYIFKKYE